MNGEAIKALRKRLGFTQEEFAHAIGVTFATVNRWENGKSKPSRLAIRTLEQFAADAARRNSSRARATREKHRR